jgi:hypothetical protein
MPARPASRGARIRWRCSTEERGEIRDRGRQIVAAHAAALAAVLQALSCGVKACSVFPDSCG